MYERALPLCAQSHCKKAIRIKSLALGQIAERLMAPKIGETVLCVCVCVQLSEREINRCGTPKEGEL